MFAKLFFKIPIRVPGQFPGWIRGLWAVSGWVLGQALMGATFAQSSALPTLKIGYLEEMPHSWRTNLADPVHNIARCLGVGFTKPLDPDFPQPENNLYGSDSWEELSQAILHAGLDDGPELFVMQAYEFVKWREKLNLAPLLLATRDGTWKTRFVIFTPAASHIRKIGDLEGKKILVLRGGCGDLVNIWLDQVIPVNTGKQRKNFARYQTVTEAREAILPVFFGESDACVVTEAAYAGVAAENPDQIPKRLLKLEVPDSKDLPSQVIVCSNALRQETQSRVIEKAGSLKWDFGDQQGGFVAADVKAEAFSNLSPLVLKKAPAPHSTSEAARVAPSTAISSKQKRLP